MAEKVVLCYKCKIRQMLCENCPKVTPTVENSEYFKSDPLQENQPPAQLVPSAQDHPDCESRQVTLALTEEARVRNSSDRFLRFV